MSLRINSNIAAMNAYRPITVPHTTVAFAPIVAPRRTFVA